MIVRIPVRPALIAASLGALLLLVAGCGSSEDIPAGAKKLSFKLTDEGCVPNSTSAPAGPIAFEVENAGTTAVTEIEVMEGDTILGEKENLSDGLSGSFSLTLDKGKYTIYCPGGSTEKGTLTVSGETKAAAVPGEAATVTKANTRKPAQEIDALAEELSQVPAQIVG